jgi:hypothetical protein
MPDSVVSPAPTPQAPAVSAGARVLDVRCGKIHSLVRPRGAVSDVLLVYECAAGLSPLSPGFATVHTGALLVRLVNGLELVKTDGTQAVALEAAAELTPR